MHFKSGEKKAKATIEIGDKTYSIFSPSIAQSDEFYAAFNSFKDDNHKIKVLMKDYICSLGSIPLDELNKMEDDLFAEVFEYVTTPKKK